MKVLILGSTGMLGDAVASVFKNFNGQVICSSRRTMDEPSDCSDIRVFDASKDRIEEIASDLTTGDYIINCIGIIKTEIDESSRESCARAKQINEEFPAALAAFAEGKGVRVIQIATDCVFSGKAGHYSESSKHDPEDMYGKTKSAGEIISACMMHLRVSIIGPEKRSFTSLYDWVARQPAHAHITGYTNHFWNGVPAKHFGLVARAIIERDLFEPGLHHFLPADKVSKATLVSLIAKHANRDDIQITNAPALVPINRTLATEYPEFSASLWKAAGYSTPPTIARLVSEI